MTRRHLRLPDDAAGRLDSVLAGLLPKVSRKRLKAALRDGRVTIAGKRARGADPAIPGAEVILEDLPDADAPAPATIALTVLHADDALVAVDKPAGVPAYPLTPEEGGTIAGAVLESYPDLAGVGDLPLAPGLCHRLDVETSGVLLFARTADAFSRIRRAFADRAVEKVYLAMATGRLEGEGEIDVALGRSRHGKRMIAAEGAADRGLRHTWPARTRWRAVGPAGEDTLVELVLVTGVTHQARAHLAHVGHPVVGDALYGGRPAARLMLHAARLALVHPTTGRRIEIASPSPSPLTR